MAGDGVLKLCNKNHVFEITCKTLKNWVAKQRLPTVNEVAYFALKNTVNPIYYGFAIEMLFIDLKLSSYVPPPLPALASLCGAYKPLAESFLTRGLFEKAKNLAIMSGSSDTISFVMKNIKGKEDIQTSMVAGFGCGAIISLVTGMRGPSVISVGLFCALVNSGWFKVREEMLKMKI